MLWVLAGWLGFVNLAAFWAFADDKARARHGLRRRREQTLLLMAAAGGSLGAVLAQQIFRHKTRKQPFAMILWAVCVIQVVIVAWVLVR
jgi:uncharacterized membrane protein YsdA (DUF1294 family)